MVVLGAVGDSLGSPVEGWRAEAIMEAYGVLCDFLNLMTVTKQQTVSPYATVKEEYGRFTDDTEMAAAVMASVVENGRLRVKHSSYKMSEMMDVGRCYGQDVIRILRIPAQGRDYRELSRTNHREGSWGSACCSRVASIAAAYRRASDQVLYEAVTGVLLPTHSHPEAVDSCFVLCKFMAGLLRGETNFEAILTDCTRSAKLPQTQKAMEWILHNYRAQTKDAFRPAYTDRMEQFLGGTAASSTSSNILSSDDAATQRFMQEVLFDRAALSQFTTSSNQDRASDAVATALWMFIRHHAKPSLGLLRVVMLGGKTSTTACLMGQLLGALWGIAPEGKAWIPKRWVDRIENTKNGRERLQQWGRALSRIDVDVYSLAADLKGL
jgi:ADP-ribosylglycohydrolase